MGSARRNTIRLAVVGLCVALVGCNKAAPQVGGTTTSKAEKARKDAEALAVSGVTGGAQAQARAEPGTFVRHETGVSVVISPSKSDSGAKGPPVGSPGIKPVTVAVPGPAPGASGAIGPPQPRSTPRSGWVIRERVASTFPYPTEADADEDALAQAREVVARKLAELDPPVHYKPSLGEVKTEFVRKDSRQVRPPNAAEKEALKEAFGSDSKIENRVSVEYDVEVTADQVRELRTQDRVVAGFRVLGVLLAVALTGFLFLRADEWTKGYLTHWLALAAVTLAGGAAAALIFV